MKQTKFRGMRTDNGFWAKGHYFETPLTDENSGLPAESGWYFLTGEKRHCIGQDGVAFTVDPKTVGQFTGLLDKNGKEIYQGDIVKCGYGIGVVVEMLGAWLVDWTSDDGAEMEFLGFNKKVRRAREDEEQFEVVGNIYEHQTS